MNLLIQQLCFLLHDVACIQFLGPLEIAEARAEYANSTTCGLACISLHKLICSWFWAAHSSTKMLQPEIEAMIEPICQRQHLRMTLSRILKGYPANNTITQMKVQ